jgi:hypothetical protein
VINVTEKRCNNLGLKVGGWLFSGFDSEDGTRFLIITCPDRATTTVMLPEEY